MKLLLTTVGHITTEIEVYNDDLVDVIRQKLVETGKVGVNTVVKLIVTGNILDLDKKISDYPSLLKEGQRVIYIASKKRLLKYHNHKQQLLYQMLL